MLFGDAKKLIKTINQKADVVFFDPFSPEKVPDMWATEFIKNIKAKMKPNSTLTTYSYAKKVRNNLKQAGFTLKDGPTIGRRSPSTIAIS